MNAPVPPILPPSTVAALRAFRLATRRRVVGRYAGGHASKRKGPSLEFAEHREYTPGDDPRRLDTNASRRLGRLLVRVTEAEDEAPLRVVVDRSASMTFGAKTVRADEIAAGLAALAQAGQDPVRVLLSAVDPGPWFRGPSTLPAVEARLRAGTAQEVGDTDRTRPADQPDGPRADGTSDAPALVAALHRAHGEGPRGPVVLVSDLLMPDWPEVLRALAGRGGDAVLIQVLGREDLEPTVRGDLRLVDADSGAEVEVAVTDATLRAYAEAATAWLTEVEAEAGRHGIAVARLVDDEPVEDLLLTDLRALGLVA